MRFLRAVWFPVAVAVLLAVIAWNLYALQRVKEENADSVGEIESPRPLSNRTFDLTLTPAKRGARLDIDQLATALREVCGVDQVRVEGGQVVTARLSVARSVRLSDLREPLARCGAAVHEDRTPLAGDVCLHVTGPFCCPTSLKSHLAGLAKRSIRETEVPAEKNGCVHVQLAGDTVQTLATLRKTLSRSALELEDVEWLPPAGDLHDHTK